MRIEDPIKKHDFAVGGQAVIEGVMMRAPDYITIAVRKTDGSIKLKEEQFISIIKKVKFFALPIVRGVVNLFEMLILGTKIINYSATESMDFEEEESEKKAKQDNDKTDASDKSDKNSKKESILTSFAFALSILFALLLSIFLFKFIPYLLTDVISKQVPILNENWMLFNFIDGILKTSIFVAYIATLGMTKSVRRLFEYHGAEHKSIFTYENGKELTVENAKSQSRFHPRCGTSFILVVFLLSIVVYTFVPKQPTLLLNFGLRILFLPVIAGLSYELLKISAKHQKNRLVRFLIAPGLWLQRLTTQEPDDKQLEVALAALKTALETTKNDK